MNTLKNKAHRLIDDLPDEKMSKVIIILEKISKELDNDVDEWDLQLVKEALDAEEKDDFVSLDDVVKEMGFEVEQLRNQN